MNTKKLLIIKNTKLVSKQIIKNEKINKNVNTKIRNNLIISTPLTLEHIINNYQQPVNQIKGYVINLKKRTDRLERFNNNVKNNLPFLSIETIDAIDGTTLDLKDDSLIKRITEWTLKNLNPKLLRGVVGCCISHLECINKIANGEDNYAIVFEDDCVFKDIKHQNYCNDFLKNLQIPEKFGVIYLNLYIKISTINCNNNYLNKVISGYQTAESYIISKEFAKIVYEENINNLGAFDAHLEISMLKNPNYPFYELKDNYFIQCNRNDSNIR